MKVVEGNFTVAPGLFQAGIRAGAGGRLMPHDRDRACFRRSFQRRGRQDHLALSGDLAGQSKMVAFVYILGPFRLREKNRNVALYRWAASVNPDAKGPWRKVEGGQGDHRAPDHDRGPVFSGVRRFLEGSVLRPT